MSIIDKINSAEYIYSTTTKWGLKKYMCEIRYFTEDPLEDLYDAICSILYHNNGRYGKRDLGVLLGFSLITSEDENNPLYYDIAEDFVFEDILKMIEKEHLINIEDDDDEVVLTKLGRISVEEKKHYKFFLGHKDLYEHLKLESDKQMDLTMFPFYKDMGIYSSLVKGPQIWPNDKTIEEVIYYHDSPLLKRLDNQSKEKTNIYQADLKKYFEVETKDVEIKLYQDSEGYIPVVMNENSIAEQATKLVNMPENALYHENLVLECLFHKLWDNKDAVLNYEALEPYFELVDFEALTIDSRIVWTDGRLMNEVFEHSNPSCWKNISKYCPVEVLYNYIPSYYEHFDWIILTDRVEDHFLLEGDNFVQYPWDLEVLSSDPKRKAETIEQLILRQKETRDDWDWEQLEERKILSSDFIMSNLDIVKVDLKNYTKDTTEVKRAIIDHPNKLWDWTKIETEFPIDFLYHNFDKIGDYLINEKFFDRIFTDNRWGGTFATSDVFRSTLQEANRKGRRLASCILNDKKYIWDNCVVDTLAEAGLINWASTKYMKGFECNPYLSWDSHFFDRYSQFVSTQDGFTHISASVNDLNILLEHDEFPWDWDAISGNKELLQDENLYSNFGKKLNWHIVLDNQKDEDFIQAIEHVGDYIGDDKEAWTKFSSIASLDYVKEKYKASKFPWDWNILTERLHSEKRLILDNIGNPLFVKEWNWSYLSENVEIDFLKQNLNKFKDYWDWQIVFKRLVTSENKFNSTFLDGIADIIMSINGDKCAVAWTALTSQYSFDEMKRVFAETSIRYPYQWDLKQFCLDEKFNIFTDLEDCRRFIDWEALSSSSMLDKKFKFDSRLNIKQDAWNRKVKDILSDNRYRWNFRSLSNFESLRDERWFLSNFKSRLDWRTISQSSKVFCQQDKQKLNDIIEEFKGNLNFRVLSEREDIENFDQIIKIYPRGDYNYNSLIERGKIHIDEEFLKENSHYDWDWFIISTSVDFNPTVNFLLSRIDENLNWEYLSKRGELRFWTIPKFIVSIANRESISKRIDWEYISSLEKFPICEDVLSCVPLQRLNWKALSAREEILTFLHTLTEYVDWLIISKNKSLNVSDNSTLDRFKEYLDWRVICKRDDFRFSEQILEQYSDYLDWGEASNSRDLNFTKDLILRYENNWNWVALDKNPAFYNKLAISEFHNGRLANIVKFINKFPFEPKAYHFTHMSNAIKIIKTMKLQSRDYAEGEFSNSAGSNVNRTDKAHRFARFYFAPKSPTQFYNEFLGKDHEYDKYDKACRLGLPKCPMPVFFIFDIEEILMLMPNKCWYSTGNMQKDFSRHFKVIDNPSAIKAHEIYGDIYKNFVERQQEFLIEGELDFSKLKNVRICCCDDYQAELLRKEVEVTRWKNIINVDKSLYEYQNKSLDFRETENIIKISTEYADPYEFRVTFSDGTPIIINRNNVLRQKDNNIYVSSEVEISKETHFEVYFEVNVPRQESWLIYKN